MSNLESLNKIVDKMEQVIRVSKMTHEYWFSERTPYVGSVSYYKVLGGESYDDLRKYYDKLHPAIQERLSPLQMNGEYALVGKLEEYSG